MKKSNRKIKTFLKSQVSDKFLAKRFHKILFYEVSFLLLCPPLITQFQLKFQVIRFLVSFPCRTGLLQLISSSPSGRAAGPSGRSFDHFKIAVNVVPEICEDLAVFFNEVLLGTKKLPHALCSSRIVALNKPNGGVRPIAVGETISHIFSTLCFRRVRDSSVEFIRPFQFAIEVPEGTTCAALTSDFLFIQMRKMPF
ncbi:hypothetical protein GEMRC1_013984 [Eukaryota sp. GEM-RC1]